MVNGTVLSRRYIVALDGLRGLAVLAVMCSHVSFPEARSLPGRIVLAGLSSGWAGVDLFFVLSGFLITGILLDTRECANYFRSFYSRRALRIFPLYYAFLLLAWLTFPLLVRPDWMPLRADWWLYPCYLVNWQVLWSEGWHSNVLGHLWSLAVEEQFYIMWPLIVFALRPRRLLRVLACGEMVIMLGRLLWIHQHGASIVLATATITRMDGLLFGAGCAVVVRRLNFSKWAIASMPWVSFLCLSVFLSEAVFDDPGARDGFTQAAGLVLLSVGFAAILLYLILNSEISGIQTWLAWKPLTRIGKYAYGIYIFHVPLFYFVGQAEGNLPITTRTATWFVCCTAAFEFTLAFIFATVSYHYFEARFLALKKYFEPEYPRVSLQALR